MNLTLAHFWIGIGVGVLCGGIIGVERQIRGKPAGIRTSILICLGTQLFVRLGASLDHPQIDPTRVLAQVVTGVGFIGAGVIIAREGLVTGVTSAAVIWILAAIGACIGLDRFMESVVMALVTVVILAGVHLLEAGVRRLRSGAHAEESNADTKEE